LGDNLIPARVKTDAQAININLMRTVQGIGQANRKQIGDHPAGFFGPAVRIYFIMAVHTQRKKISLPYTYTDENGQSFKKVKKC
jgi:hypothetical protein